VDLFGVYHRIENISQHCARPLGKGCYGLEEKRQDKHDQQANNRKGGGGKHIKRRELQKKKGGSSYKEEERGIFIEGVITICPMTPNMGLC